MILFTLNKYLSSTILVLKNNIVKIKQVIDFFFMINILFENDYECVLGKMRVKRKIGN